MLKVFVSSTYRDLVEHRQAVINLLHQTNDLPIAMETFGSKPGNAETASLDEVGKADVFVGIYAHRYGYVPDDDRSVTEMEYQEARRLELPCLIFIVADDYEAPALVDHAETDDEAKLMLSRFKRHLMKDHVVDRFTTPDDLADKVLKALYKWQRDEMPTQSKSDGINIAGDVTGGNVGGTIQGDQNNVQGNQNTGSGDQYNFGDSSGSTFNFGKKK
jgi:hypothetical protein